MSNNLPELIDISINKDRRGNLSVVDKYSCLPFDLKRLFYVYDIPAGTERGGHAHFKLIQFIWPVSGSLKVNTIDSQGKSRDWELTLPWQGLLLPPMTWASETALSAGTVYLVAASDYYDADDYIRDFRRFSDLTSSSTNHD